jgi:hypothetical protein
MADTMIDKLHIHHGVKPLRLTDTVWEGATSLCDFRSRGLAARSALTTVVNARDGLAPLFLGGDQVACNGALLETRGVSHVVNATTQTPNYFPDTIKYLRVPVLDSRAVDLRCRRVEPPPSDGPSSVPSFAAPPYQ